jgi:DNA invertase Pin-like site-specific DNA recombinase
MNRVIRASVFPVFLRRGAWNPAFFISLRLIFSLQKTLITRALKYDVPFCSCVSLRISVSKLRGETSMSNFGYIRVSTQEQNEDRQRIALTPCGIPGRNLYIDHVSGKDFNRPSYQKMLKRLRPGDLLTVKSIDRLGRNYAEIIEQWRLITKTIGADIQVLDMPLLNTTFAKDLLGTFISDLVLQVLSFSAQLERDHILQRQAEGFAAAKARGVRLGREPIPLPEGFDDIYSHWTSGEITASQAAAICGIAVRTLYEKTRERRECDGYTRRKRNGNSSG